MQGRNRRCVTVDLHNEQGQELIKKLAQNCDVLLENFRPGVMEQWGLGPEVRWQRREGGGVGLARTKPARDAAPLAQRIRAALLSARRGGVIPWRATPSPGAGSPPAPDLRSNLWVRADGASGPASRLRFRVRGRGRLPRAQRFPGWAGGGARAWACVRGGGPGTHAGVFWGLAWCRTCLAGSLGSPTPACRRSPLSVGP